MRKLVASAVAIAVLGLTAGRAVAALSQADKGFAVAAAQAGLAEVEAGNMAMHKAASAKVKQFGQTLIDDHGKANHELWDIANAEHVTLPAHPNARQQRQVGKLGVLSGAAFDKTFLQDEIEDHKKAIAAFATEAKSGTSPDLKAFAAKNLPVLEKHLRMAESLSGHSDGLAKAPTAKR